MIAQETPTAEREETSLVILYEDERLLAVAKPAGLVVHPAYKHPDGTLTDAVFARQRASGGERPWLLHRLDRDTTGVVLFAKTENARRSLVRQIERRSIQKTYLAIVAGSLAPTDGLIDAPLARDPADRRRVIVTPDGQPATTRYRVLASGEHVSLVLAEPLTGRTHQIRAHLTSLGAPLLGDALYAAGEPPRDNAPRAMLHAWQLRFMYPMTGEPCAVTAPIPDDMLTLIRQTHLEAGLSRLPTSPEEDSCS